MACSTPLISLSSLLGIYLFQLFADLHPVFANTYLHKVNSDKFLVCEAYSVAQKTATILKDPALKTPNTCEIIYNLSLDQFNNVVAKFDGHQVTLNVKLTNRGIRILFCFYLITQ